MSKKSEIINISITGDTTRVNTIRDLKLVLLVLRKVKSEELNIGWHDTDLKISIKSKSPEK